MLDVHGVYPGLAPYRHMSIGSLYVVAKIGYPAEVGDWALSMELRKVYTAHLKALDGKAACVLPLLNVSMPYIILKPANSVPVTMPYLA